MTLERRTRGTLDSNSAVSDLLAGLIRLNLDTCDLKGSGHYWLLLKIIITIKPEFVTSNGEKLIV